MSSISSVIVLSAWMSDLEVMEPLTRRDDSRQWRGAFTCITDGDPSDLWVGNGKGPECQVWVGAFNHLNRPALLADLESLPWEDPAGLQVLINWNDEETFGLWMFKEGRLREVPLPGWTRRAYSTSGSTPKGWQTIQIGFLAKSPPAEDPEPPHRGGDV